MSDSFQHGTTIGSTLRRNLLWVGVTLTAAFLVACGPSVSDEDEDGCQVGDQTYAVGESFQDADGCNTCTCQDGGAVACTEMACLDGCTYDGQNYDAGDSFPASDGCNSCSCESDGSVACTTMACANTCTYDGQVYNPGDEFEPIGGSTCGDMCSCLEDGTVDCEYCAS
ncbi:MAG: hypothetical protein DRI90_09045 [Deltaproteobacteria bacterium]|nr:MAG: hypothetical protein DRI90_09045 [Deltaproteobacteria bacterium]